MARKTEYDEDRDQHTRNAEAQIALTQAHEHKVRQEAYLFRAKAVAYWAGTFLLGSAAVRIWF